MLHCEICFRGLAEGSVCGDCLMAAVEDFARKPGYKPIAPSQESLINLARYRRATSLATVLHAIQHPPIAPSQESLINLARHRRATSLDTVPHAIQHPPIFCSTCGSNHTARFAEGGKLSGRTVYRCKMCNAYFYVYHPIFRSPTRFV